MGSWLRVGLLPWQLAALLDSGRIIGLLLLLLGVLGVDVVAKAGAQVTSDLLLALAEPAGQVLKINERLFILVVLSFLLFALLLQLS